MKLAFRKFGEGKALLILHGLFGQSDNWNTLAKQFSEQNFEVFTIDLRNHGLSPHHQAWDYEVMASDIYEFIHDYNIQHPILLGHSMGGKVAMNFALNYDDLLLDKLIVADIAPVRPPNASPAVCVPAPPIYCLPVPKFPPGDQVVPSYSSVLFNIPDGGGT